MLSSEVLRIGLVAFKGIKCVALQAQSIDHLELGKLINEGDPVAHSRVNGDRERTMEIVLFVAILFHLPRFPHYGLIDYSPLQLGAAFWMALRTTPLLFGRH